MPLSQEERDAIFGRESAIDLTRPKIKNPDGSFSTEETITIEEGGKHFNIPTIIGGKRRSEDEAVSEWKSGRNPEVGSFGSQQEALSAARARSEQIGRVRGGLTDDERRAVFGEQPAAAPIQRQTPITQALDAPISHAATALFGDETPPVDQAGLAQWRAKQGAIGNRVAERRAEMGRTGEEGTFMRHFDAAAAAIPGAAGSALTYAGRVTGLDKLKEWGEDLEVEAAALTPEDQTFTEKLAGGAASTLAFLIPGMGVGWAAGRGMLALGTTLRAATIGSRVAGAAAATVLESAGVAEEAYKAAMDATGDDKVATGNAAEAGLKSLGIVYLTDRLGVFGDAASALRRIAMSASMEGIQEGTQQYLTNRAGYRPAGEGVTEAAIIGAAVGGGITSIQAAGERYAQQHQQEQPPEDPRARDVGIDTSKPVPPEAAIAAAEVNPNAAAALALTLNNMNHADGAAVLQRMAAEGHGELVKEISRLAQSEQFVQTGVQIEQEIPQLVARFSEAMQSYSGQAPTEAIDQSLTQAIEQGPPEAALPPAEVGIPVQRQTPAVAPAGPAPVANPLVESVATQLESHFKQSIDRTTLQEGKPDADMVKMAAAVKDAFDVDILWLQTPEGGAKLADGQSTGEFYGLNLRDQKAIAVNLTRPKSVTVRNTIGHELTHQLKQQQPEIYKLIEQAAFNHLSTGGAEQIRRGLLAQLQADEKITGADLTAKINETFGDEAPAEVVGELWDDQGFWDKVFAGAPNSTFARRMMQTVKGLLDRIQRAFMSAGFVRGAKDINAMRKAAADAFQKWEAAEAKPTPKAAPKAEFQRPALPTRVFKGEEVIVGAQGKSRSELTKAVRNMVRLMDIGMASKGWYVDSAKQILEAAGGDRVTAERIIQLLAITSNGASVKANVTFFENAIKQWQAGKPIKVGKPEVNNAVRDLLYFGRNWSGRKTNDFYTNLMDRLEGRVPDRPVIDRHQFELMLGKGVKAAKEQSYNLAQMLVREAAGKRDLASDEAQAAMWVGKKAEETFAELKQGRDTAERSKYKNFTNKALWDVAYGQAKTSYATEFKERALKFAPGFFEKLDDVYARVAPQLRNVTAEVVPSTKTKIGAALAKRSVEEQRGFQSAILKSVFGTEAGKVDFGKFFSAFGLDETQWRVVAGEGGYEAKIAPNVVIQLKTDAATADRVAKAWMYIFRQDAVPWFRADPDMLGKGPTGLWFSLDRMLTPAQERALFETLRREVSDQIGFTRIADTEYAIINFRDEEGVAFTKLSDDKFVAAVERAMRFAPARITESIQYGTESSYPWVDQSSESEREVLAGTLGSQDLQDGLRRWADVFKREAPQAAQSRGAQFQRPVAEERQVVRPIGWNDKQWTATSKLLHNDADLPTSPDRLTAPQRKIYDSIHSAENLNEKQRRIETLARIKIAVRGVDAMEAEYDKLADAENGKVLNTDTARELFNEYLLDRTQSPAVHEPASWLNKEFFRRKLTEPLKPGERAMVLFTSGGTGAGKTTAIRNLGPAVAMKTAARLVYDTNVADAAKGIAKMEQAMAAGNEVAVLHVVRDPIDALVNGAVARAIRQAVKFGSGRTVLLKDHVQTHAGANRAIGQVVKHFGISNERFDYAVIDNRYGLGKASFMELLDIPQYDYEAFKQNARRALDHLYEKRRIPTSIYRGFVGDEQLLAIARRLLARDEKRIAEKPEPKRPEGRQRAAVAEVLPARQEVEEPFLSRLYEAASSVVSDVADSIQFSRPVTKEQRSFFEDLYAGTQSHPFDDRIRLKDMVGIEASPWENNSIHLSSIISFSKKRAGEATAAMKWMIGLADKHNVRLEGFAKPIPDAGAKNAKSLTRAELIRWYKKLGFTEKFGRIEYRPAQFSRPIKTGSKVFEEIAFGFENRAMVPGADRTYFDAILTALDAGTMTAEQTEKVLTELGNIVDIARDNKQIALARAAEKAMRDLEAQFSRPLQPRPAVKGRRFVLPAETRVDRFLTNLQDRFIRIRNIERAAIGQGGVVPEEAGTYRAEERFHGRVAHRLLQFKEKTVEPLLTRIGKDGIELSDIAMYMYAHDAPRRNAWIARINPTMPDGGSGMTNAEAARIIATYRTDPQLAKIQAYATELQQILQSTRNLMVSSGLITPTVASAWEARDPSYVPLRGFEKIDETGAPGTGTGRGFDVRGKESRRAMGRESKAGQIVENIILDHQRAIVRAEKNVVAKALLNFVLRNPDPDLWQVDKIEPMAAFYKDTLNASGLLDGEVRYLQKIVKDPARTIMVKHYGQEYAIWLKDPSMIDALLGKNGLMNADAQEAAAFMRRWQGINRMLAKMWTSLNPVFTGLNFTRDFMTGMIHAASIGGAKFATKVARDVPSAMKGIWDVERNNNETTDWAKWYKQYESDGGKTGFYMFGDMEDRMREINRLVTDASQQSTQKEAWKAAKKAIREIEDVVMDYNAIIENAIRVSSYKNAIESGKSRNEAASIAKNLTVNFNRKGNWTPMLSSFYLFFNPAVQGVARMTQAAQQNPKAFSTAVGSLVAMGIIAGLTGGDDKDEEGVPYWDKIPGYEKQRSLVLPLGGGRRVTIPLPYGYGFFVNFGYGIADLIRGRPVGGVALDQAMSAGQHFSPLGTYEEPVLTLVPTVLDPFFEAAMNRRATGQPLMPDEESMSGMPVPGSERYWGKSRGTALQEFTTWLNEATGGTKSQAGAISLSPELIKNFFRYYTGGVGTFITDSIETAYVTSEIDFQAAREKNIVPFLRQFYKYDDVRSDVAYFYEAKKKALSSLDEAKKFYNTDRPVVLERIERERGIAMLGASVNSVQRALRSLRLREIEIAQDKEMSFSDRHAARKEIDEQKKSLLREWNAKFYEAESESRQ